MDIDGGLLRTVRLTLNVLTTGLVGWLLVLVAIKHEDTGAWLPVTVVALVLEVGVEYLFLRSRRQDDAPHR